MPINSAEIDKRFSLFSQIEFLNLSHTNVLCGSRRREHCKVSASRARYPTVAYWTYMGLALIPNGLEA
jgi:hypothetical protein